MDILRNLCTLNVLRLRPYVLIVGVSIPIFIAAYYCGVFSPGIAGSNRNLNLSELERLELMYKDDIKENPQYLPIEFFEFENATADLNETTLMNWNIGFVLHDENHYGFGRNTTWFKDGSPESEIHFARGLPFKILIHDAGSDIRCSFPEELVKTYLRNYFDFNIVSVDWANLASSNLSKDNGELGNYMYGVSNVGLVGRGLGNMIAELFQHKIANSSQIHLIGLGLGAHIAGHAGQYLQKLNFSKIHRITGLDPSGLFFVTGESGRHLQKDDAKFVDIAHTDMYRSGTFKSTGHANFFINGGHDPQPGCKEYASTNRKYPEKFDEYFGKSCSHHLALSYYTESIATPDRLLVGQECEDNAHYHLGRCNGSRALFGERCDRRSRGNFYLDLVPPSGDLAAGNYSCKV